MFPLSTLGLIHPFPGDGRCAGPLRLHRSQRRSWLPALADCRWKMLMLLCIHTQIPSMCSFSPKVHLVLPEKAGAQPACSEMLCTHQPPAIYGSWLFWGSAFSCEVIPTVFLPIPFALFPYSCFEAITWKFIVMPHGSFMFGHSEPLLPLSAPEIAPLLLCQAHHSCPLLCPHQAE